MSNDTRNKAGHLAPRAMTRHLVVPEAVGAAKTQDDFHFWNIDFRKSCSLALEVRTACAISDRVALKAQASILSGDGKTHHPIRH